MTYNRLLYFAAATGAFVLFSLGIVIFYGLFFIAGWGQAYLWSAIVYASPALLWLVCIVPALALLGLGDPLGACIVTWVPMILAVVKYPIAAAVLVFLFRHSLPL